MATLAMPDYFCGALEQTNLAQTRDIAAVPFDAKLEVFVGIKAVCVVSKLCHLNCYSKILSSVYHTLLGAEHHEFSRVERGEVDINVEKNVSGPLID